MQPGEAVVTGARTFLYQPGKKPRTMRATATVKKQIPTKVCGCC
jgi:hypothetical protein